MNDLFVIDWGEGCQGGRFALIKSPNLEAAWLIADMVGAPFKIAPFEISEDLEDIYLEFNQPDEPYHGSLIADSFEWKTSAETFAL